jgi:hypothetical protein
VGKSMIRLSVDSSRDLLVDSYMLIINSNLEQEVVGLLADRQRDHSIRPCR